MLSLHYILRNWQAVARRAQETFPLRPDYTAALFAEFRRVGRTTLFGTIVTGLAQGVLATLGYWISGVREPVFFGAATAIASLIHAVGTMLVWVPAGIYLLLDGHPARGVLELVWGGAMVVGVTAAARSAASRSSHAGLTPVNGSAAPASIRAIGRLATSAACADSSRPDSAASSASLTFSAAVARGSNAASRQRAK